jgi:hypothetical protein
MSRRARRWSVTLSPNLREAYKAIHEYYSIAYDDHSTIYNMCIHTVAKALAERLKKEREEQVGSPQDTLTQGGEHGSREGTSDNTTGDQTNSSEPVSGPTLP